MISILFKDNTPENDLLESNNLQMNMNHDGTR